MKKDKKILIIEKDGLVALDLKRELEKKDFSVNRESSITDSETIIKENKTDLIIANTDIQSESIFHKLKTLLKKIYTPFIWIGTLSNKESMKESEGINVIKVFPKPFISIDIVAFIVAFFNKRLNLSLNNYE